MNLSRSLNQKCLLLRPLLRPLLLLLPRSSVHGVTVGASKIPRVIIYSPVASPIFFISARDAVGHGAGLVERSSAHNTMTQTPAKKCQMRRIIMIHAVLKRRASTKKITVLEAIIRIVESVGEGLKCSQ